NVGELAREGERRPGSRDVPGHLYDLRRCLHRPSLRAYCEKKMPFLKKVVVVEDEDAVAHLIEAALGDAGYLCLRAHDGTEALKLAKREEPDLLVLDILMPKMDGLETVRRLKSDPVQSRIPVLMLTALGSIDDRVRGLGAGADDYLPKPFDVRELLARCQSLVRHNRRERDRSPTTG